MRESQVEKHLAKRVAALGGLCWKFVSPNLRGVPDRIVVMPEGRVFFVELKAPGELPKEIERNLGINDKILRYLVIKLEEKKQSVKPRPVRAMVSAPVAEATEAPAAASDEEVASEPTAE